MNDVDQNEEQYSDDEEVDDYRDAGGDHRYQQQQHAEKEMGLPMTTPAKQSDEVSSVHRTPSSAVRLPPVPRRADQLIKKLVEQPLAERSWVSSTLVSDSLSPLRKRTTMLTTAPTDLTDESLLDPHLQGYWERKLSGGKPMRNNNNCRKMSRQRQSHQEGRAASSMLISTPSSQGQNDSGSRPRRSQSSLERSSAEGSVSLGQHQRRQCPIPLNPRPLSKEEFLCFKTLLGPERVVSAAVTLDHMDLGWLRSLLLDKGDNMTLSSSSFSPQSLSSSSSAKWLTLRTFNTEALAKSSEHHTKDVPFHEKLLNSPRSCLVLVRNGIKPYALLARPPRYYVGATEAVSAEVMRQRHEDAEGDRVCLLESLRSQYDMLCGLCPREDAIDAIVSKAAKRTEDAQRVAHERFERDQERLNQEEERDRRMNEVQRERMRRAADRSITTQEKIERQRRAALRVIEEKGTVLKKKLTLKKRILEKIHDVQHIISLEAMQTMDVKREQKAGFVQQHKDSQRQAAMQRAEENSQKIQRSRSLLEQREAILAQQTCEMMEKKRQKAEAFLDRKAQEHAERVQKSGAKHERQEQIKHKAEQTAEDLRERIETKLQGAQHRYDELLELRQLVHEVEKRRHDEREAKIKATVAHATQMQAESEEQLRSRAEAADRRIQQRSLEAELERIRESERLRFALGQKNRLVTAREQQMQFDKLCDVASMNKQAEEIRRAQETQEELVRLTQSSRKLIKARRDHNAAAALALNIAEEKKTWQTIYELSHPKE